MTPGELLDAVLTSVRAIDPALFVEVGMRPGEFAVRVTVFDTRGHPTKYAMKAVSITRLSHMAYPHDLVSRLVAELLGELDPEYLGVIANNAVDKMNAIYAKSEG
jgi:hypothetical protein